MEVNQQTIETLFIVFASLAMIFLVSWVAVKHHEYKEGFWKDKELVSNKPEDLYCKIKLEKKIKISNAFMSDNSEIRLGMLVSIDNKGLSLIEATSNISPVALCTRITNDSIILKADNEFMNELRNNFIYFKYYLATDIRDDIENEICEHRTNKAKDVKYVYYDKRKGKFKVTIMNGKYIGYFESILDAVEARDEAIRKEDELKDLSK